MVTKDEMLVILKALYKLQSSTTDQKAEAHVENLYKALDKNKDGKLTKDEFMKLATLDPALLDLVCGFSK